MSTARPHDSAEKKPASHQHQAFDAIWASNLPTAESFLLFAYAKHLGNDDWDVWPSARTLAKLTRMTERGVKRIRARLIEMKVLSVAGQHSRQRRRGNPRVGRYSLCVTFQIHALRALGDAQP